MAVRMGNPRIAAFVLATGLLLAAAGTRAAESCLKLVFDRYCLGGDINALLQTMPQPMTRQSAGDSLALVFADGVDTLYVLAFQNRIYKIVRAHAVSTQLRYEEIYGLLRDKYGPGEDQSRFPDSAILPAQRLAAIRRGEGRAMHVWHPSPDWHIELSWTRELGLALAYVATELSAARAAQIGGGL